MEIIKSLENRIILLKGNTGKVISQEGGLLNILAPLIRVGVLLMKNVLTLFGKSALVPLGVTVAVSGTDEAIQRKVYELWWIQ